MRDTKCRALREQFVTYALQTARLGTPYCGDEIRVPV